MVPQQVLAAAADRLGGIVQLASLPESGRPMHVCTGGPQSRPGGRLPSCARPVCGTRLTRSRVWPFGEDGFVLGRHVSGRRVCGRCSARFTPRSSNRAEPPHHRTRADDVARFSGMSIVDIYLSAWAAETQRELDACSLALTICDFPPAELTGFHKLPDGRRFGHIQRRLQVRRDQLAGGVKAAADAEKIRAAHEAYQADRRRIRAATETERRAQLAI